jgi:hypothetical protein
MNHIIPEKISYYFISQLVGGAVHGTKKFCPLRWLKNLYEALYNNSRSTGLYYSD